MIHDAGAVGTIEVVRMIWIALPAQRHVFYYVEALLANWLSFGFRFFFIEAGSAEELLVVLRQGSAQSRAAGVLIFATKTFEAPICVQSAFKMAFKKGFFK